MFFRTANPALSDKAFDQVSGSTQDGQMTISGTVNKTFILLALVVSAAIYTWTQAASKGLGSIAPWMIFGAIGGLVIAIVTVFKKEWVSKTAPIYAVCQGLFLGGISSMFEAQYPGLVIQAVGMTFGTLFCLLGVYKSGLIKVTDNLRMGIAAAMGGLMLVYLVTFVLGLFGVNMSILTGSGPFSILISLVAVTIASLNLVLDFDFIEKGAAQGAPKYMEWYGAFGLMVTLIWLYIEILRLLSKLRDRRN